MKKRIVQVLSMILSLVMLFSLYSCTAAKAETVDLMADITPNTVEGNAIDDTFKKAHADFSAELFKRSFDGENTLISPLSVMLALGMTATGAEGNTANQFTELFGGISADELSKYLCSYVEGLTKDEKNSIDIANSVWYTNRVSYDLKASFLQGLCDYYSAEAFAADLQSNAAVEAVNGWIEEKTDGMIKKMLEYTDSNTRMLLVNALLFEAEWAEKYEETQVRDGIFTTADGDERNVTLMYSEENGYLENEYAVGFVKPYAGDKYEFVGLLPKDGVSLRELADSIDGESLHELLGGVTRQFVYTAIPQLEFDYKTELSGVLNDMGLTDVSDFGGMFENEGIDIKVMRVLHNTRIELTPVGTKAGAATVVMMNTGSAAPGEPPKEVYLDRPFVYMIVDTETNLPIFIGAVTDIGE